MFPRSSHIALKSSGADSDVEKEVVEVVTLKRDVEGMISWKINIFRV